MSTPRSIVIGIVAAVCLMIGCTDGRYGKVLSQIDTLIENHPDSALLRLDSIRNQKESWPKSLRMRYDLLEAKARNKAFLPFTSDSIAKDFTAYYDSHGTANERMLAHYLLGCAYRDLGEAPHALQSYYDAIEQADTASKICDINVLIGIYGQMAHIFHKQNLPTDELWALHQYLNYIEKTGDTLEFLTAKIQMIRPYYLMGEKDTILQIIQENYRILKKHGYSQQAADILVPSIYIYTEKGLTKKAKQTIDIFENESGLFDKDGNIAKHRESYYYSKGFYYLAVNQTDSAEFFFRKALQYGYYSEAYKGLLHVYREKCVPDSIVRFSCLYEAAQDSLHNQMQTDAIHQMSSLYNYSRSQKIAEAERRKAQEAYFWLSGTIQCIIIAASCLHSYYRKKKEEIRKMSLALTAAKAEQRNTQIELQKLKSKDYESLIAEKEKTEKELQLTIDALQKKTNKPEPVDQFTDFENSNIVKIFREKSSFKIGTKTPTGAEWKKLVTQFSISMPALFNIFSQGKLSPLELNTCILLLLNFPEGTISGLTNTTSQSVSTAKRRANQKLFQVTGAHTLKNNLIQAINHP